jgi:hypothetical protein
VKAARELWRSLQADFDPKRLVFIDETGAKTNMARLYGRAPRGQRVVAAIPHGHWKTVTFVGALRHDHVAAPMTAPRAMNGGIFTTWVEQVLLPTLEPGDIVVMDNLPAHKVAAVKKAILNAGMILLICRPTHPTSIPSSSSSPS